MSPILSFITPIPAGSPIPYKFITYGDMGIAPYPEGVTTAHLVTNNIKDDSNYRFILHHGDLSYARGLVSTIQVLFSRQSKDIF